MCTQVGLDQSQFTADVWANDTDFTLFELLWIRVYTGARELLVGALSHPPKPMYKPVELIDHIDRCINAITVKFPAAIIILAGDFNQLCDAATS